MRSRKLDASPPLAGGPNLHPNRILPIWATLAAELGKSRVRCEATANSRRGSHAGKFTRRGGYPSPKIAAASRQRFVGPPTKHVVYPCLESKCRSRKNPTSVGGLDGVCGSAFHFWRWVAAICNTRSVPPLPSAPAAPAARD